jgi:hypothetical protein
MDRTQERRKLAHLEALWRRWVGAIAQCLGKTQGVTKMSAQQYRELHAELLREISPDHIDASAAPIRSSEMSKMYSLCRPWVSLDVLKTTERHILNDLCERGRQEAALVFGEHKARRWSVRLAISLLVLAACLLITAGVLGGWFSGDDPESVVGELSSQVRRMGYWLQRVSFVQWMAVAVGVIVVVGFWMLNNTRKY